MQSPSFNVPDVGSVDGESIQHVLLGGSFPGFLVDKQSGPRINTLLLGDCFPAHVLCWGTVII